METVELINENERLQGVIESLLKQRDNALIELEAADAELREIKARLEKAIKLFKEIKEDGKYDGRAIQEISCGRQEDC